MASLRVLRSGDSAQALASVVPPADGAPAAPANLVIVLDRSGSMGGLANLNGEIPYTRLEIVKRALEAVIACMEDGASLTIVTFHSETECVFGPAAMTPASRRQAVAAVMNIVPFGGTELWDGLKCGLAHAKLTRAHVFLLTDGEASSSPAEGERAALKAVRDAGNACRVTTIALGPSANAALLGDLSSRYVHIFDGSMVITVFAHLLAALQSVAVDGAALRLADGTSVPLGPVRFGQPVDTLVPADGADAVRLVLPGGAVVRPDVDVAVDGSRAIRAEVQRQAGIAVLRHLVKEAAFDRVAAAERVRAVVRAFDAEDAPPIQADLKGEVMLALDGDNWSKWGKDFVPSLLSAHLERVPGNSKDLGCQGYCAAGLFRRRLNACYETCAKMPPPVAAAATKPMDAASYVRNVVNADGSGSCFGLDARVFTVDGGIVAADAVQPGMRLAGGAIVRKVVRSAAPVLTVDVDGVPLTSSHPVRVADGDWVHAVTASSPTGAVLTHVVNFVLDARHVVHFQTASGAALQACTLGHGFEGPVVGHGFFGTARVLDALAAYPGWDAGVVIVGARDVVRDARGWVCDLRPTAA